MCTNSTEWDSDVVEDLFNDHDKQLIYNIQLAKNCRTDTWFWAHELNGIYTVKSAYKLARNMLRPWDENNNDSIWKRLWRVKVPAKVKTFLWRTLANCLPTLNNLQTKKNHVCVTCPLCGLEEETADHCLIHCIFARACWNIVCPEFKYDRTMIFQDWLRYLMAHLSHKTALIFAVCWGIWKARNEVVWNHKTPRAGVIVSIASANLIQWQQVQVMGQPTSSIPSNSSSMLEQWTKSRRNCIKVNCDVSVFNHTGSFGVGWIARDADGDLISAATLKLNVTPDIHWAETICIREALT